MLATPLLLAAPVSNADTIDVGVVIDKKVVELEGNNLKRIYLPG